MVPVSGVFGEISAGTAPGKGFPRCLKADKRWYVWAVVAGHQVCFGQKLVAGVMGESGLMDLQLLGFLCGPSDIVVFATATRDNMVISVGA